jgi:hypothetical protein
MDLRKEEAKTALRKLIGKSDVLVQNFRPGTVEEMGFGYDVLKTLNPRIIMVNVSAYGQFGPYREQIGYDPIGQTMSGVAMVTGETACRRFARAPIIDRTTALHSATRTWRPPRARIRARGRASTCLADRPRHDGDSHHRLSRAEPSRSGSDARPAACTPARTAGC